MSQGVPPAYVNRSKLEVLLGRSVWKAIDGKLVVDFGCGEGYDAVELAERGAAAVVGIDLRQLWLEHAEAFALARGVSDRCTFVREWRGGDHTADVIISLDSFEHFEDPAAILRIMHRILKPEGSVLVSFGPPWYHPYGGHLFSVFPWAHCVFTERALVQWRGTLAGKRPTRSLVDAGLNRMTIARFERLVRDSPFAFASFEAVPIRKIRWAASRLSREFTTSIVRCRLIPK